MRFSLMILSLTAVLATDFAVKNVTIGQDGTLWYRTIESPVPSRETRLPAVTPDATPMRPPSAEPAKPIQGNLPQAPALWDYDELV